MTAAGAAQPLKAWFSLKKSVRKLWGGLAEVLRAAQGLKQQRGRSWGCFLGARGGGTLGFLLDQGFFLGGWAIGLLVRWDQLMLRL